MCGDREARRIPSEVERGKNALGLKGAHILRRAVAVFPGDSSSKLVRLWSVASAFVAHTFRYTQYLSGLTSIMLPCR